MHYETSGKNTKCGFTLIELLVTMAIISILVALLLSAVQSARESARLSICRNNLKQFTLAIHNYHDVYGYFPAGGNNRIRTLPMSQLPSPGISWITAILPYIEQSAIYDKLDLSNVLSGTLPANYTVIDSQKIPMLMCPSSPLPVWQTVSGKNVCTNSYAGISGAVGTGNVTGSQVSFTDDGYSNDNSAVCCVSIASASLRGLVSSTGSMVPNLYLRMRDMSDGLSGSLLLGEVSNWGVDSTGNVNLSTSNFGTWMTGSPAYGVPPTYLTLISPPTMGNQTYNLTTIRYPIGTNDATLPGVNNKSGPNNPLISAHRGGAMCAFGDGKVKFMSDNTDLLLLKYLATRSDGHNTGE
jgi:prepilin-type N-terminal cleavage/methylation domain-containing protein